MSAMHDQAVPVRLHAPLLGFTTDGRCVARAGGQLRVIQRDGAFTELGIAAPEELAVFADQLWVVRDGELARHQLDGRAFGDPIALDPHGVLVPAFAGTAAAAWVARDPRLWFDDLGELRELSLPASGLPFAGRRAFVARHDAITLGATEWQVPAGVRWLGAAATFEGAGCVLVFARRDSRELWCSSATGRVQHRISLPASAALRLAGRRGILLVASAGYLTAIDLRAGRTLGEVRLEAEELAIDSTGTLIALHDRDAVTIVGVQELLARRHEEAPAPVVAPEDTPEPPPQAAVPAPAAHARPDRLVITRPLAIPALPPRVVPDPDVPAALEELDAELRLVMHRAVVAIAEGWDTRRIGYPNESANPHEHEVAAIVGINHGFAQEHVAYARRQLAEHLAGLDPDDRRRPTSALGSLAADLGLSSLAVDILLAVAAPAIWGDVARLYGILANDPARPMVDEQLLVQILPASRHEIARELDPRAPLVRTGAIDVAASPAVLFAALTASPIVIARLRARLPDLGGAVTVRVADRPLEELDVVPRAVEAGLASLARARAPLRLVVRGRPGAGRRTLLAALVGETRRGLGIVDASNLATARDSFADELRDALRGIHLAGLVPAIVGLEQVALAEGRGIELAAEVLREHPGPLGLCLAPDATSPLAPGHVAIELPLLDETTRLAVWQRELATHDRWVREPAGLAARYRVGPGTIRRAIAGLDGVPHADDATEGIDRFIRQSRDGQLGTIARRVERLASWSNLVLPPEVMDSLRELVARVRHRRRVFEDWGMDGTVTTSRGLTALFQGQPGTGKTLVAGVIARELGLDLYQIDLSKIMSKWIGETERNLAAVFDAAEDGQVILLFDEADSLFAKRTDVRSSNDRYANLEVNYLLQRLDAFEGIAILTTNFGGSIDPAFKRRLSFRLEFPFPDEDTRVQLWRSHLPPRLPVAGELALDALARKYQLSGGYIRNACLRAAFLAAQDESPLSQRHLERAVVLEFTDAGKLSSSGAIA